MAATTTLTSTQFREDLKELLSLASEYAALESRIKSKAFELADSDWVMGFDSPYLTAVGAQVKEALDAAKREHGHSEFSALDLCQDIQHALDVLGFATKNNEEVTA